MTNASFSREAQPSAASIDSAHKLRRTEPLFHECGCGAGAAAAALGLRGRAACGVK